MSKLTPKELTELTVKGLQKRKEIKKKGQDEAKSFVIEMCYKHRRTIEKAKGRGFRL